MKKYAEFELDLKNESLDNEPSQKVVTLDKVCLNVSKSIIKSVQASKAVKCSNKCGTSGLCNTVNTCRTTR